MEKAGADLCHQSRGGDYFPGYGLDPDAGYRPFKALAKVIEAFGGHKDGWGLAYWFRSDTSFLGGKRPQDLLASAPDRVIAAALDEIQVLSMAQQRTESNEGVAPPATDVAESVTPVPPATLHVTITVLANSSREKAELPSLIVAVPSKASADPTSTHDED